MKKKWINPLVFGYKLGDDTGDPWVGNGSLTGTPDKEPWPWAFWSANYEDDDSDKDGVPGQWGDYVQWMIDNGFGDKINWDEQP